MKTKQIISKTPTVSKLERWLPYLLIVAGVIGSIAAIIITRDKFELLKNPNFRPACSLNPVISCGSVMQSAQSHIFGFDNPYIGLVGFPVLITTGFAILAGARFKRWYWLGLNAGLLFGFGFVHWLFFESVYRIHALCLYCMSVWIVIIASFWYVTLYNIGAGHVRLPKSLQPAARFARHHHLDILVGWYLIIAALILKHFWYYYGHGLFH